MHCTCYLLFENTHPGQLVVPAEDVYANEREHPGQGGQDLLGDVVGGVEPQAGVLQHFQGLPDELDQGQAGHAVHNDVGHALPDARLGATVICEHPPVKTQP